MKQALKKHYTNRTVIQTNISTYMASTYSHMKVGWKKTTVVLRKRQDRYKEDRVDRAEMK